MIDRCIENDDDNNFSSVLLALFVSLLYKISRFHVALRLSRKWYRRHQNIIRTSLTISVIASCASFFVFTTTQFYVICYYWTDASQYESYLLERVVEKRPSFNQFLREQVNKQSEGRLLAHWSRVSKAAGKSYSALQLSKWKAATKGCGFKCHQSFILCYPVLDIKSW